MQPYISSDLFRDDVGMVLGHFVLTGTFLSRSLALSISYHFWQTAHLTITSATKHGDRLVCSYPPCRNAGVKFVYCAHCRAPVARRSFLKRHDHHQSSTKGIEKERTSSDVSSTTSSQKLPTVTEDDVGVLNISEKKSSELGTITLTTSDTSGQGIAKKTNARNSDDDDDDEDNGGDDDDNDESRNTKDSEDKALGEGDGASDDSSSNHLGPYKKRKRTTPIDEDYPMSNATSSASSSPPQSSTENGRDIISIRKDDENCMDEIDQSRGREETSRDVSDDRLARWEALLYERPNREDEDRMSAWLMKVLALSDPSNIM